MPEPTDPTCEAILLSPSEAAILLASGRGVAGRRLQRAVEAQLGRRGVVGADHDDVRADVAFALLVSPRTDRLTLDAVCALVSRIARNKAIDQHRRRRHDAPGAFSYDRVAAPVEGRLARGLDIVSGEVHGRAVSRALVELVAELPPPERRALTATATGSGSPGSGLGRSSHYRALDRARLRLSASVRARIAGGLAIPLLFLRNIGLVRDVLAPLGAVVVAGAASAALVLPAFDLPPAPVATAALAAHVAVVPVPVVRVAVLRPARRAPARRPVPVVPVVHVAHRRSGAPVAPAARPHRATRVVRAAPRHTRPTPPAPAVVPVPTADAGLSPCRAALLCK